MRAKTWAGTIAVVLLTFTAPASAATVHVSNTHDHGRGSLRKAIERANPGDRVDVPGGHYVLTTGELLVDKELKITGAGARETILDANRDSRVMNIDYAGPGTMRVSSLTVRDGDTNADSGGGGINVDAIMIKLVLTRVAVLNNRVITNTDIQNGGGVDSPGDVVIRQSLFAGNHAYNGGAVAADLIKASDSTFFNNFGGNPNLNGDGGAFDDEVELTDSTVFGNQCFNSDGCGGGLYGSDATLKGTIVAGNRAYEPNGMPAGSAGNPGTSDNCASPVTSLGHNLDDHNDCALGGAGDITGRNPRLGGLENNGGQTNTLALASNSPAFNAGAGNCTRKDQRGIRRPQGNRCDIGAFELVP
ncbi:MAG: hypothetical protein QOI31_2392 [Solirubrobacterales bacterium]|nr:hypothetical protein [Solirubrobacterales bacterium]